MSWQAAMTTAYNQAKCFRSKRYVWAWRNHRDGKVYWTVTEEKPEITFRECWPND